MLQLKRDTNGDKMNLEDISDSGKNKGIKDERNYDSMYSVGINKPLIYSKKKKKNFSNMALITMFTAALGLSAIAYVSAARRSEFNNSNQRIAIENRISTENTANIKKNNIRLNIEGIVEDFVFSPEPVKEKELNQGIIVWEKIKKGEYEGKEIRYPIGHLYVFKDISTRKIVGKFAVSGGILGRNVESIKSGVYVLNKFELYPDYVDETGRIIVDGGDKVNPWGYGRFYHYPVTEKGSIMNILHMNSFKRSIYPDKKHRYLHACSLVSEDINGKEDYRYKKKELRETDFQPTRTIGCMKTSNYAIDFLEERINQGFFRLAYIDNTKKR